MYLRETPVTRGDRYPLQDGAWERERERNGAEKETNKTNRAPHTQVLRDDVSPSAVPRYRSVMFHHHRAGGAARDETEEVGGGGEGVGERAERRGSVPSHRTRR